MSDLDFDFIVVGSGSAGATGAARLSESGRYTVLLLEAGARDTNPWIHIPAGFAKLFTNPSTQWGDLSVPEPELLGRPIFFPYGKVLGGSSSVNGMLYVRGQREDYDQWAELGNSGWGYDDVLPYFRRSERHYAGDSPYHGGSGPIHVSRQPSNEIVDAFVTAATEVDIPANGDFNAGSGEGAGYYQLTTNGFRRFSTATGFLKPARRRRCLHVETGAQARRLLIEGRRAKGIEFLQNGQVRRATARREIVLSAGVFNSPHLLQLSGIGAGERLSAAGIEVLHALPGIGENLQDHLIATSAYECSKPITVNDALRTRTGKLKVALDYAFRRSGLMTMGASYGGGFFRAHPGSNRADVQCFFSLYSSADFQAPDPFPGLSVGVFQSRPASRGSVRTIAPDPMLRPEIRLNALSEQIDRDHLLAGLRLVDRVMRAPGIAPYVVRRARPLPQVASDDDLLDWARSVATSALHGVGTCRMGIGPDAVVDPRLRVHGIKGLRVADGSIMPTLVSGNTGAPIMMIGEKAADMILEDAR